MGKKITRQFLSFLNIDELSMYKTNHKITHIIFKTNTYSNYLLYIDKKFKNVATIKYIKIFKNGIVQIHIQNNNLYKIKEDIYNLIKLKIITRDIENIKIVVLIY